LGVLKRKDGYYKMIAVEVRFVQGCQKMNDGSRKVIHLGTIDRGFTANSITNKEGCGGCKQKLVTSP
jgi:hypothetical protein